MNALDIKTLLPELKKQVTLLSDDLLKRVNSNADINSGLLEAFHQIEKGGRTSQAYEVWLEDYLDQVAVAWVLACVFVRYMEDNELIDECWLAGEGERRTLAEDTLTLFFRENKNAEYRDYLLHVFRTVGKIPAAAELFAEGKTPLWAVAPSGDASMNLLKFWREISAETGKLQRTFAVATGDTRFLGDLYQDLSQKAQDKYALKQTPVFVEEFILEETLIPAIQEFGLSSVRMIDPTCGSGHFLLGGFSHLSKSWNKPEYTSGNTQHDAQKALDAVWGVDINPFAIAIARFRLIVEAMHFCGLKKLKHSPGWKLNLATGDSLLFGNRWYMDGTKRPEARYLDDSLIPSIYACEDKDAINLVLGQQYHAVVGNPPYIPVHDKTLSAVYRKRFPICTGKYSLCIPFIERFFELAMSPTGTKPGFVGAIVSSSFSKNQFGKALVERHLPKLDLTHILDTSDAYLPGHNTATVILFGRNRAPTSSTVRCVLGIKGEQGVPADPAIAKVWMSIKSFANVPGASNEFVSSTDLDRKILNCHPWTLRGGGIVQLKDRIDQVTTKRLQDFVDEIGVLGMTNADEVFLCSKQILDRYRIEATLCREIQTGNTVRDWTLLPSSSCIFPYVDGKLIEIEKYPNALKRLWPFKTSLGCRATFDGGTYTSSGLPWWKWHQISLQRIETNETIVFAEIATSNHFVFVSHPLIYDRTGPIIKLKPEASYRDYVGLTSLLNCSVACMWMKESCRPKGGDHVGKEGARVRKTPWDERYAFSSNPMKKFPLTESFPSELGEKLHELGKAMTNLLQQVQLAPDELTIASIRHDYANLRSRAIALQEELDWECYVLYGLTEEAVVYEETDPPSLALGERAFEIAMARRMSSEGTTTTWFTRHSSLPIEELPKHWPLGYRNLVEQRIALINSNSDVSLIEKPEYKRRWNTECWDVHEKRALRNWLLSRLELIGHESWKSGLISIAKLTESALLDSDFTRVATLFKDRTDFDLSLLVAELVESEAAPALPVLRYKASGMRKHEIWIKVWEMQRLPNSNGENSPEIRPPEYKKDDFISDSIWLLRGKLDVPKERWVSYPFCSTDGDSSLVIGRAGWNHLEHATALVSYYDARKREGWDAERLKPLLAGLDQLVPWIHQWHPEVDPEYGETAGQSFQHMLETDAHELGLTLAEIRAWAPPAKKTKPPAKPKAAEKLPRKPRQKLVESENDQ